MSMFKSSCATNVPTNVRSEHQLEVSLQQVLHLSWMKSQLKFEVNILVTGVRLDLRARVSRTAGAVIGQVPVGRSCEPL